ncbi:hypothetical protein L202_02009 [Cryptococcus amylolentus CBS 6039]|uniref:Epoxide hydrolase N-terminal domain-containing protein n=2 Tax=Cryptococcus amylolentus TaxID=104669 RepID=A0A1E3HZE8_9TREE|nr:hypothetical protein L202_02009 [Cryptococcus amylolentus CBS 6039]ODN81598.1 hypothetical protein L202_02009 [Cryptococcus amylolentus CBS 6039]ODO10180.1 hypothetical protein I350_02409 [Cryptococcus amylolentus CBS 6273]
MPYSTLPNTPTIPVEPFRVAIPQSDVDDLKTLLRLSRITKETYESTESSCKDNNFGTSTARTAELRDAWMKDDWRKHEEYINSIPQFTAVSKTEDDKPLKVHFAALFSEKKDAAPIIMNHGWPGCFLEFYAILKHVEETYTPSTLPYHIIVPSLPGYAFSDAPPLDRDFSIDDVAFVFNGLMEGLGFGTGYVAQGGDIGSFVTNALAANHPACKIIHLNFRFFPGTPTNSDKSSSGAEATPAQAIPAAEPLDPLLSLQMFGYALEQGTRPSTIGITVGANPISLIAWIGEKLVETCPDRPLSDEGLVRFASLYWFTDSFASSIYPYRYAFGIKRNVHMAEKAYIRCPTGYSVFPFEYYQPPQETLEQATNIVYYKVHDIGGHFAAMGQPKLLWGDIEENITANWGKVATSLLLCPSIET